MSGLSSKLQQFLTAILFVFLFLFAFNLVKAASRPELINTLWWAKLLIFLAIAGFGMYTNRRFAFGPRSVLGLRFPKGHCQSCGYDRRATDPHAKCPECGHNPAAL